MTDIEQAQQQAQQARQMLEQKRQEAQQAQSRLRQQEQSLPQTDSQKALRDKFSGIQGRNLRQQINQYRQDLQSQSSGIEKYQSQVLSPYEKQLSSVERNIQEYKADKAGYEGAKKLYEKGIPINLVSDPYTRKYLKQFYEQGNLISEYNTKLQYSQPEQLMSYAQPEDFNLPQTGFLPRLDRQEKNFVTGFGLLSAQPEPISQKETQPSLLGTATSLILAPTPLLFSDSLSTINELTNTGIDEYNARQRLLSQGTFTQSSPEFENEVQKQTAVAQSIRSIGVPAFPALAAPKTLEIPVRNIKNPLAVEIRQPANIYGKPVTLSRFEITQELTPPIVQLGGKAGYLGKSDVISVKAPTIQTTKTILPITNNKIPYFTSTFKQGSNLETLNLIQGKSIPRSVTELKNLPKTERFAWKGLAEELAGRPVSYENVPKILNQNAQLSSGYINQVNIKNIGTGRSRSIYTTASQMERARETAEYDIFTGKTTYKEITKPFSRATGKTPTLNQVLIKVKEPLQIGEDTGVVVFRSSGKKTPFQTTFTEQLQLTPKPIPKPTKPIKTPETIIEYGKSGVLSGVSIGSSRGIYIRDSGSDFNSGFNKALLGTETEVKKISAKTNLDQQIKTDYLLRSGIRQPQTSPTLLKIQTAQQQKSLSRGLFSILGLKSNQDTQTKTKTTQKTPPRQSSIGKTALLNMLGLKSTTTQKTPPRQSSISKTKPSPSPPPFQPFNFLGGSTKTNKKDKDFEDLYKIFGKRRGKDILLGVSQTQKGASFGLKKFLKGTLGASGFISKGGKPIKINLGTEFRPSKKESYRVVQKRKYRLGTKTEVNEILGTKRKSKINWFGK